MKRIKYQVTDRIVEAARLLGPLAGDCVFAGGSSTGLLLTDPAIPDVRPTLDVDVIVEMVTRSDYYRLQEALKTQGFNEDIDSGVICRWTQGPIILDVMPTDSDILGFSNSWYADAFVHASECEIEGLRIRHITPAYFLATKLEAFHGRGGGDYLSSHDMEDLIALIDGRIEIVQDVTSADGAVKEYLAEQFSKLLGEGDFMDALPGHLNGDPASQARVPIILDRIRAIIKA